MSSFDYYNDDTQWGDYSYVTLEQIINDYMVSKDQDDYDGKTPRYKVVYQAKRGLRELYFDVLREIRAIELELSPSLNITLPPDFVNIVRMSWVDENNMLYPMTINNNMNMADVYLQDNQYELLFDSNGEILEGSIPKNGNKTLGCDNDGDKHCYTFNSPFKPNQNFSYNHPNGKYTINKSDGIIQFGSEVFGKIVVLEYISDGLFTGSEGSLEEELRIHKFAEKTLRDFIYYELIQKRRNVPYNEKMRARKEYYNSRRITKRRIATLRKEDLLQAFKASNRWIKY